MNKRDIACSFSRAALTYDQAAALQRQIGARLLSFLPADGCDLLVDLGCGTGNFTRQALRAVAARRCIGLDLAEGMLLRAQALAESEIDWLSADMEQLPLKDAVADLLVSNLALQWCPTPHLVLREAARVLKPGAWCCLSTFGPRSLHELRSAWAQVDPFVHVNHFASHAELQQAACAAGFDWICHQEILMRHYGHFAELGRELKQLGAHNLNAGRPRGLTSRTRLEALLAQYECFRDRQGNLPCSYEVFYLLLRKAPAYGAA